MIRAHHLPEAEGDEPLGGGRDPCPFRRRKKNFLTMRKKGPDRRKKEVPKFPPETEGKGGRKFFAKKGDPQTQREGRGKWISLKKKQEGRVPTFLALERSPRPRNAVGGGGGTYAAHPFPPRKEEGRRKYHIFLIPIGKGGLIGFYTFEGRRGETGRRKKSSRTSAIYRVR